MLYVKNGFSGNQSIHYYTEHSDMFVDEHFIDSVFKNEHNKAYGRWWMILLNTMIILIKTYEKRINHNG